MRYEGTEIRVSRTRHGFDVEPSTPELNALVFAVGRWSRDEQVTFALRGHGFGGDGFGLAWPNDVNGDWEYEELGIRLEPDQILVSYGFDDEHCILGVDVYLECLEQALLIDGLDERAETLARFREDRSRADRLPEADVALCRSRFAALAGILRGFGWVEDEEIPGSRYLHLPGDRYRLYFENIDKDMDVFSRECESRLADIRRHPEHVEAGEYVRGLESVLEGVRVLRENERRTG